MTSGRGYGKAEESQKRLLDAVSTIQAALRLQLPGPARTTPVLELTVIEYAKAPRSQRLEGPSPSLAYVIMING